MLVNYLKEVAASLGRRLNREGIRPDRDARIKYANFTSITALPPCPKPHRGLCLYQEAETMLDTGLYSQSVRLIGLRSSGLIYDDPVQLTIEDFLREEDSGLTRK